MAEYMWLVASILLFVAEAITTTLVSIWFAIGAAAAMVAAFCGADVFVQWVIFIAVSALLLIFTRNAAKKWLMPKIEKTNSESLVGEVGIVTEDIDNLTSKGRVEVKSQSWKAKSDDGKEIASGQKVVVVAIHGVTLEVKIKED